MQMHTASQFWTLATVVYFAANCPAKVRLVVAVVCLGIALALSFS